eukprot:TRINITY_DN961_c0_g3_i2.p1 TRINITY_DN961_c0_g3~~TRINITY_DN961_c0_g3_i2.p1  ORF type:complete len:483 (-),score=95.74 TRINITY_DN961_c0_g3_i2:90-1538(-)
MWRNDIDEVAEFFYKMFGQHFMIINLSGVSYDYSKFGFRVRDFAFPDHSCPPLELLFKILETMDQYLKEDPANVVAVHCLAGRGRTGTIIAAYLLYTKLFDDSKAALDFFATKRSSEGQGVIGPSQIRYVEYYHKILKGYPYTPNHRLFLKQICVSPIPAIEIGEKTRGSCTPAIKIYSNGKLVYSSMERRGETFFRETSTDINLEIGVMVSDDVQIKVYHRAKSKMKFMEIIGTCKLSAKEAVDAVSKYPYIPLFRYTFHTSFIDNSPCAIFTLPKRELDAPFEGRAKDTIFPSTMTVSTFFVDPTIMQAEHIPYDPSIIPQSSSEAKSKRNSDVNLAPTKPTTSKQPPPRPQRPDHPLSMHQLPPVTSTVPAKRSSTISVTKQPPSGPDHVPFLSVVPNPIQLTPLDHSPYPTHLLPAVNPPVQIPYQAPYQPQMYTPSYHTQPYQPTYQPTTYSSPSLQQEAHSEGVEYHPVFVPLPSS